ncbi:MAG: AraC family transcriptional regulator, partial [Myxococcales bacterium]
MTTLISRWRAEGLGFQRVDADDPALEFRKIFHDEIVLLAFRGAVWRSEQAGCHHVETPECVVLRDAGQVFSTRLEHLEPGPGMCCRELHIPPARMEELYERSEGALPRIDFRRPVLPGAALARSLERVHRLFEQPGCGLEASTALAGLLAHVARVSTGREMTLAAPACSRRTRLVIAFLRDHFDQKITLSALADLAQLNPYVLLRQFRKETGLTPHDYLRAYRVYRARGFIEQGVALADVALRCGFADQSHLNRQFKQSLSISPRRYRSLSSKTRAAPSLYSRPAARSPGVSRATGRPASWTIVTCS